MGGGLGPQQRPLPVLMTWAYAVLLWSPPPPPSCASEGRPMNPPSEDVPREWHLDDWPMQSNRNPSPPPRRPRDGRPLGPGLSFPREGHKGWTDPLRG